MNRPHRLSSIALLATLALLLGACIAAPPATSSVKRKDGGVSADMRDTSGNCGALGGNCCAGQVCDNTGGLTCSKQGVCCGAATASCSSTAGCCAGLACTDTKCCVALAGACQNSGACCAGLACTGGVCDKPASACGVAGKPCCPNSTCTAGNQCTGGTCVACGASGEACCTGNSQCKAGLTCSAAKLCGVDCGATGKKCCTGAKACNDATASCNSAGICAVGSTAGTLGNACRPNQGCDVPLTCVAGKCQEPSACKTVNSTCCAGNHCDGALQCAENNTCQTPPMCLDLQDDCTSTQQCCTGKQCLLTVQPEGQPDAKTCCVGEGKSCPNGDLDCCGYLLCDASGTCRAQAPGGDCLQDDDCTNRSCDTDTGTCAGGTTPGGGGGGGGSCSGLSASCTADGDCCKTTHPNAVCKPLLSTGAKACCLGAFETCANSKDCCGAMACDTNGSHTCLQQAQGARCVDNGDCVDGSYCGPKNTCDPSSSGTASLGLGEVCNADSECSGTLLCPFGNCCSSDTSTECTAATDCCGSLTCDTKGALSFTKYCCRDAGDPCSVDDDCCAGRSCRPDGRCQRVTGGDCTSYFDCDGTFSSCDNNLCT